MALFSYRQTQGVVQLTLESGVAPMNILGLHDPKTGIDFRSAEMLASLKVLAGGSKAEDFSSDPRLWQAQRARAVDLAAGRLFLSRLNEEQIAQLRTMLDEMGHSLEPTQRKATYHLKEGFEGAYVAVPGNYALTALSAAERRGFQVAGIVSAPDEPLHRLVMESSQAIAFAQQMEDINPDAVVLNHTNKPVLKKVAKVAVTRPFLVSAKAGAELHLVRGNLGDVMGQLEPQLVRTGENGSLLLRGTVKEQKESLRAVQSVAEGLDLRTVGSLVDVPEDHPKVAVASRADKIINTRLESTVAVTDSSLAKVNGYALKESALEPQQAMGAAFILDQPASLNADATGGGKTLMTAVGLHLKTPPGEKILVTCPPGIITQWVRCVDRFLPDLDGPDALPENQEPDWLKRLPKTEQDKLAPSWERVRKRFVFLPESALESGVVVSRATFKVGEEVEDVAAAQNALTEIRSILKEPISSVLVDEAHEHRNAGRKFELLENITSGKARDLQLPIKTVVLATATPLHRDAPDLFPLLRMLGVKKFQRMEVDEFCDGYCHRKVKVGADGKRNFMAPTPPYGYGMLREEKIAEIAAILGEKMISREKQELTPNRIRTRVVSSPLPYAASESLGVTLSGFTQAGNLVKLPTDIHGKLASEGSYQARRLLLAHAKVPRTAADAIRFLKENPEEKLIISSHFISSAEALSAALATAGIRNHNLTSRAYRKPNGRGVGSKQQLVDDFLADKQSRVMVVTTGAGGTGIDGLHTVAHEMIINDFTPEGGKMAQLEGRIYRTEAQEVSADARPVHIRYQVADHPMDQLMWEHLLTRRHEMEFVRTQGLLQGLDSPEAKAASEMLADQFAEKVYARIGETQEAPALRDNSYLLATQAKENFQLDFSYPTFSPSVSRDEATMRIGGIAPPAVSDEVPSPARRTAPGKAEVD